MMMKNFGRAAWLTLLVPLLPAAACAQGRSDQPSAAQQASAEPDQAPTQAPPAQEAQLPYLTPRGGPPGTKVTVTMNNLLLGDSVEVGFGSFVEHQILVQGNADPKGSFSAIVPIPAAAQPGPHYFFIAQVDGSPMAVSDAFLVTRPDGTVRLRGQMTNEGGGCKVMRGLQDELYALVGNVGTPAVGARVTVEGALAQGSTCQRGLPIEVKTIQVDP